MAVELDAVPTLQRDPGDPPVVAPAGRLGARRRPAQPGQLGRRAPAAASSPDAATCRARSDAATRRELGVVAQHAARAAAAPPTAAGRARRRAAAPGCRRGRRTASAGRRAPRPAAARPCCRSPRRPGGRATSGRSRSLAISRCSLAARIDFCAPARHDERAGRAVEQPGRARPRPRPGGRSCAPPPASAAGDRARAAPRRSSSRSSTGCCSARRRPAP